MKILWLKSVISCKVNSLHLSNERGLKIPEKTATAKTTPYYQLTSSHSVSKILYWCATAFWVLNRRQWRGDSARLTDLCHVEALNQLVFASCVHHLQPWLAAWPKHTSRTLKESASRSCAWGSLQGAWRGREGFPYLLDWRRWSTEGRTRVRHRACTGSCRRWTLAALRTQTHPWPPLVYSGAPPAVKNSENTRKGYLGCLSGSCSPRSSGEMSFKHTRQTPGRHLHPPFVCCGA